MSVRIKITGPQAIFARPECKRDSVTYDMLTPLAARSILDTIHWRPAIRWVIDRIRILEPINILTGPSQDGKSRDAILIDVGYIVEAHFDMTEAAGRDEPAGQHFAMFKRALKRGKFPQPPYFGRPDFVANVSLLTDEASLPVSRFQRGEVDLGLLLHDVAFDDRGRLRFFRAIARDGWVDIPAFDSEMLFG